jgi:hypothetical protein
MQDIQHSEWPRESALLFPCSCCGYRVFSANEYYEFCPVCYWERWPGETAWPDSWIGTNSVTLRDAQRNFLLFGAISEGYDLDFLGNRPREFNLHRDPNWKPLAPLGPVLPYALRTLCKCCGYRTICVSHERCEICGWEYSPQQNNADDETWPNLFTLRESQENFRRLGVKDEAFLDHLRSPTKQDIHDSQYVRLSAPSVVPSRCQRMFSRVRKAAIASMCLCCGYQGISGSRPKCRFCCWVFSPQQECSDDAIGPNSVPLRVAQRNFMRLGAITADHVNEALKPGADDVKMPEWRPSECS